MGIKFEPIEEQPKSKGFKFEPVEEAVQQPVIEQPEQAPLQQEQPAEQPVIETAPITEPQTQVEPDPIKEAEDIYDNDIKKLIDVYYTPEEIESMKAQGPIGLLEARKFVNPKQILPAVNAAYDIYETTELAGIALKLSKGEQLSDSEKSTIDTHFKQEIEKSVRGMTVGGKIMNYGATAPAQMIEFAASFGVGRAAVSAAKIGVKKAIKSKIAKGVATITATTLATPQLYVPNYGERVIANNLGITDKGELVLKENQEAPAITALKALTDSSIEVASEMSGGVISKYAVNPLGKFVAKPIKAGFEKLPSAVKDGLYEAYKKVKPTGRLKDLYDKAQFHGILSEIGEERVADVLKTALDLDSESGYTTEQFANALFPDSEQLMIEAGIFAIGGGTLRVGDKLIGMLKTKGYSDEQVQDVMANTSVLEKEKMFADMTQPEIKESLDYVAQSSKEMFLAAGVKEEEADAASKLVQANSLWASKAYGVSPRQYWDSLSLTVTNQEEINTNNENFKTWSDNAPLVKSDKTADYKFETNNPVVIEGYHGSNQDIEIFKAGDVGLLGQGIYFTPEADRASMFAKASQGRSGGNASVTKAFVKFKTPLVLDPKNTLSSSPRMELMKMFLPNQTNETASVVDKKLTQAIKDAGHDGVILLGKDGSVREIMALNPNQIKSVFNNGGFSLEDNRISYQDNRGSITFKNNGEKVIQLFNTADSSTLFHELGHLFLNELRTASQFSKQAKEQYEAIKKFVGAESDIFSVEQEEKFAVSFEQYLAEGIAPSNKLRDAFESLKEFFVEVYQYVSNIGGALNNETRKVIDQMLGGKDLDIYYPKLKLENHESGWAFAYRQWVDELSPITKIREAYEKNKGKLPDGMNPEYLARLYASIKGRILANIQDNTYYFDDDGNMVVTGEGLKQILDDFDTEMEAIEPDYNQRIKDFNDYLVAKRYTEDLAEREDVEVNARQLEDSTAILAALAIKYGDSSAKFEGYAKRVYEFQKRILENLVRSGIMSKESFNEITNANQNYVPFQRVFEENEIQDGFVISPKGKFESASLFSLVKKIKGSDREVKDVFQSILINTSRVLQAQARNDVARSVARIADFIPENVRKIKGKTELIKDKDGNMVSVSVDKPFGNVIEYKENGKRKFLEMSTALYEAMNGLHPAEFSWLSNLLSAPSRLFRAFATLPPDFILRNWFRDVIQASIQAKEGVNPIDIVKGLTAAFGKNDLYKKWRASGGSFDSYMDLSDKSIEQAFKEIIKPNSRMMRYAKTLGVEALKDLGGAVDSATRIGMYRRSKKAGKSDMLAALESRDGTLDFSRAGRAGRLANRFIPFLNAAIQGSDKLIRAAKENPEVMVLRGLATITMPSLFLTGYYLFGAPDDERKEFLEIPQWQRDLFWVVKVDDTWLRIPKPFSLGYAFGTMPERFMTWAYNGEDKPEVEGMWREAFLGLAGSLSPVQDIGTFLTPVGKIMIENMSNYSFFSGRSIYPNWMDRKLPEERYTKTTTEISKELGNVAGMSPALIDNALRGMMATTTPYVMGAGDSILRAVKKWNDEPIPEKPEQMADKMFIRGFSIRRPSGNQAISTQNFYRKWEEVSQVNATFSGKKGKDKEEFLQENQTQLAKYKGMKRFYDSISDLNDQIDQIYDDPNMSGEEKIERIKPLEDKVLDIAKQGNRWANSFE